MAAVPVTIAAMIYPKNKTDKPYPATVVGFAWVTGLSVGGGPMPGGGEGKPPGIWGGSNEPFPTPPIYLPPEGTPNPPEIDFTPSEPKPPPAEGGWGWSPDYGWGYFPGPGQAGPKAKK